MAVHPLRHVIGVRYKMKIILNKNVQANLGSEGRKQKQKGKHQLSEKEQEAMNAFITMLIKKMKDKAENK